MRPRVDDQASRRTISRQLRAMIEARGESASSLGRQSGVDAGVISRFLRDERDITLGTLDRLADVMGLRLIEGAKGRPPSKPARPPAKPTRPPRPARPDPPDEPRSDQP